MTNLFLPLNLSRVSLDKLRLGPRTCSNLVGYPLLAALLFFNTASPCSAEQQAGNSRADRIEQMDEQMDTDNSGTISEDEFIANRVTKARRVFERADQDKDGFLSKDEIKSLKEKRGTKVRRKTRRQKRRRQ